MQVTVHLFIQTLCTYAAKIFTTMTFLVPACPLFPLKMLYVSYKAVALKLFQIFTDFSYVILVHAVPSSIPQPLVITTLTAYSPPVSSLLWLHTH